MEARVDDIITETLELRVLHGPQAGSTLPVEPGQEYTLGTSDVCAAVLAGTQVEQEHAALCADADGIQVTLLQGKVTTLDRTEVSSGQVVPLGTVLRLGRVKLTVEPAGMPWPQDDVLEEPDPPAGALDAAPSSARPEPAVQPEPLVAARSPRGGRRHVVSLVLFACATLLVSVAVAAWVSGDEARPAGGAPEAEPIPAYPMARAPIPVNPLTAPEPRPALSKVERLALVTRFVDKRTSPGQMELRVEEAGGGEGGALRIAGAAATQAAIATLKDEARTELADAGTVEVAVLPRSELAARFEERLKAAGLARKFRVAAREPRLDLHAVLNPNEVRTWENLFQEFTREWGTVLAVRAQVDPEKDMIESHVEVVVAGAFPFVVTKDGRRISPGGVLEGRTLTAIRDGELHFSDGTRVRYAN